MRATRTHFPKTSLQWCSAQRCLGRHGTACGWGNSTFCRPRKMFVNVDAWEINPVNAVQAALLNDASDGCPCGGMWQPGVTRTLRQCAQGSCPNTAYLGASSLEPSKAGIAIGQAMFTAAQMTAGDSSDSFILGRFDLVGSCRQHCACLPARGRLSGCIAAIGLGAMCNIDKGDRTYESYPCVGHCVLTCIWSNTMI